MRLLALAAVAAMLVAPGLSAGQDQPLDPKPITWRGLQMGPEQVFEGDFTNNYDTSAFRAAGASAGETMWLFGWEDRPGDGGGITRRYHIRFVGRRTVEPGKYGALGAYPHTVLLTRLLAARLLIGD
jgi:hypothetical protein